MPAVITHHLFGEKSAKLLPSGILTDQEELLAFLLGNQGPDPFFFRFRALPDAMKACHSLGKRMHHEKILPAFSCLRSSVGRLPQDDQALGRAFALGVLSHYALDRAEHPFIFAEEDEIIEACGGELDQSHSQVHAIIEGRIDSWMLWKERHHTVLECPPALELCRTPRIDRVAGALFSQVAWQVYGIDLGANEYGAAVSDMQLAYRIIEPAGSWKGEAIGLLEEQLVSPFSMVESLAHEVTTSDTCPFANQNHLPWTIPGTDKESTASFMDLFDQALDGWPALSKAFSEGGVALEEAVNSVNYEGKSSN